MTENPVLVDVLRGKIVESRHRGAYVVMDADGRMIAASGNIERPIFPRSAVKVAQALPFVESGAADRHGFGARELSLATASHNGEEGHASLAEAMLVKAGLDRGALECGAHAPMRAAAAEQLAAAGRSPCALHNNCSGKHAGFLCFAVEDGLEPHGYIGAAHPVQIEIRAAMSDVFGTDLAEAPMGIDGCSIPTYAAPLRQFALGFARMGAGIGLSAERAKAARRLLDAAMAEPWYMAGTGRFDTDFMTALGTEAYVKVGAEGVYCASLPRLGLGIALKIDDGAGRAAEVAVASLIAEQLGRMDDPVFQPFLQPVMKNWNGIEVGTLRRA
jgi:L-asparaginase II